MARIAESEIARLKQEFSLERLCLQYGIELKKRGNDLIGHCPLHEDRTPSFVVSPQKNLWNCLGKCGCGGSVIDLVMKKENISFRHAVEKLFELEGKAVATPMLKTRQGNSYPILIEPNEELSDAKLLNEVVEFYHQTFLNQPQAMQYLAHRKAFHPEAVKKFKLGYANRTLGYRIPDTLATGKQLKERLQKLGILRQSGHEHLSGCVVVPVFDANGNVTELYGRRITAPSRNASDHLYLPGAHAGVWNRQGLVDPLRSSSGEWLLCESAIDALSFYAHGFENVTWSYGVNGFTPDHWKLLKEVRPQRVIICYDNDEAGNAAANELAQKLEAENIEAWRIELPAHSDVNDVTREHKEETAAKLAALLAAAKRMLPEVKPNSCARSFAPLSACETVTSSSSTQSAFQSDGKEAVIKNGERHWRVRGLESNKSFEQMKVNVRLSYRNQFHIHTFDLYNARHRAEFVTQANQITGVDKQNIESDLAQLITGLEEQQQKRLVEMLKPVALQSAVVLTPKQEQEAIAILKNPRLLDVVAQDLHRCGMVGEQTNLITAWLVSLSRKLERPLGVCVMSRSAAGKSTLLESVSSFVPEEDKHHYTALTPQALFHMPSEELKHKALFLAEDVGAESASYSLKTIQSDGQLIIACTMKDEATGQMVTKTKVVHGPVALFLTSTSRSVDDELLNRLLVLTIDESAEQTQRIHIAQRHAHTLQGIMERRARPRLKHLHQNIQRLIRPLMVNNPFEDELTFKNRQLRSRRDHQKYLDLIAVMALAHQYQREIKSAVDTDGVAFQYIEVTQEDIACVDRLMQEVLQQTTDELWPASRRMLAILQQWPKKEWTRREVREQTGWSDTQVRLVLGQLVAFEYLLQIGIGGRGNLVRYRLADEPQSCEASSQFAVSSQSQHCELSSRASSLIVAAKENSCATSQSLNGVHEPACASV